MEDVTRPSEETFRNVGEEDWRALSQRAKKLDKENY
jgi:hypothetical protein